MKSPSKASPASRSKSTTPEPTPNLQQLGQLIQLEASNLQFDDTVQQLLTTPRQAVYVYNHQSQHMVLGGAHNAALYGYTEAEINALPERWASIAHPDEGPLYEDLLRQIKAAPSGATVSGDFRILRKDGRYEHVAIFRRALQRDPDGEILLEIGMAQITTPLVEANRLAELKEASLKAFIQHAADGVIIIDSNSHIEDCNDIAASMLRQSKASLIAKDLDGQLAKTAFAQIKKAILLAKKEGKAGLALELEQGQKPPLPVDIHIGQLPAGHLLLQFRDTTERNQRDAAKQAEGSYYRGLFENNTSGVVVFDKSLQIEKANRALRKMLGLRIRDVEDRRLRDLIAPSGREAFADLIRQLKNHSTHPSEIDLVLRDNRGAERVVQASPTAFFDEKNRFVRGILILTDITARRRSERALHAELTINNIFFNQTPLLVAMMSPDGRLIRINPAGERLFGFRSAELEGQVIWDLQVMDAIEAERSKQRISKLLAGELTRISSIIRLKTRGGVIRTLEAETVPVIDIESNIEMIVATGVDITEKHQLVSEVINIAEREQVRIGHDLHDGIGQMLTGIVSLTESLASRLDGQPKKEAARILELVNQTLTDTRNLSHGLSPATVKSRGLSGGLKLIAANLQGIFPGECTLKIDETIKIESLETKTHLYRIAQEAVNNAIKHGSAKHITIALYKTSSDYACLEIVDDGGGFDENSSNTLKGIGLQVMAYRTSLIGGDLKILGLPKRGVRIICCFPTATLKRNNG